MAQTIERLKPIQAQTTRMERLYQAGQTDLLRLLLVRQRAMEAENARLDALWQSTQAYADLLAAVGALAADRLGVPITARTGSMIVADFHAFPALCPVRVELEATRESQSSRAGTVV